MFSILRLQADQNESRTLVFRNLMNGIQAGISAKAVPVGGAEYNMLKYKIICCEYGRGGSFGRLTTKVVGLSASKCLAGIMPVSVRIQTGKNGLQQKL